MIKFSKIISKPLVAITVIATLSACSNTLDRIENIGQEPPLKTVSNPIESPSYKPVTWPLPEAQPPAKQYAGSLWQQGSRHFFRDQRAARVGDIVRVMVEIQDKAELDNESTRGRINNESLNAPALFGLESAIYGAIPGNQNPDNLLGLGSNSNSRGTGSVEREEIIETQIAAIVTQVLPNGNLVIEGNQEIRVNFEVREIAVAGVIRPEDIKADNTIESNQIAQARISYGGRGQITAVQQPRYGNQVIDILSPF